MAGIEDHRNIKCLEDLERHSDDISNHHSIADDNSVKTDTEQTRERNGCKARRNISCDSCSEELGEEQFCDNCMKRLCKFCYEIYKNKATDIGRKGDTCSETCKNHPKKVTDCYCETCDQIGCSVCMVTGHRDCPQSSIKYIPNIAFKMFNSEEHQSILSIINQYDTDLEKEMKNYKSNCSRADFLHERAMEEVKKQRDRINRYFDALQHDVELKICLRHDSNVNLLESVSETHRSIAQNLITLKSKMENDQRKGNACQLFSNLKTGKEEIERIKAEIINVQRENVIPYYEIELPKPFKSLQGIEALGKLVTLQREIKFVSDLTVSSQKDCLPFCCITGICLLSRSKLVITDYKNCKLKVFDTSTKKQHSELTLPGPWAVAKIKGNSFAVTLPTIKAIQVLSMTSSFSICPEYQLFLCGPCRSIACTKEKMVVTYFDARVHILDMCGNLLKDLSVDGDSNNRFEKPWNVALNPDETVIYVSDLGKHTVSSFTFEGEVLAVFIDNDMGGPRGLTVDPQGAIFVCCYLSNKILQLSKDLIKVCDLLDDTDGINKHRCLAYSGENNQLFVGKWEDDVIKVFDVI